MSTDFYLGLDVGSVSTNVVATDADGEVVNKLYLKTQGQPINIIQAGLREIRDLLPRNAHVRGVGTTGSGRRLACSLVGADVVKNEITAHATATLHCLPEVRTILEIGGQDSKIIILNHGVVTDFAMNTVCAAGTGSFLDRQASRLGIEIEQLGELALQSNSPTRIAGRCAVFAESDMIHKQQIGHSMSEIVAGLCQALVRNYLNNVAKGKKLLSPIVFQGGVAANVGIRRAFETELETEIVVPEHANVMGAWGAALLARQEAKASTLFKGFGVATSDCQTVGEVCHKCANLCEIVAFSVDGEVLAHWGDRCGRMSNQTQQKLTGN